MQRWLTKTKFKSELFTLHVYSIEYTMNIQCTVVECRMEIAGLEKKTNSSLSFGEAVFTFSFPQVIELYAFVCYSI